MPLFTHSMLTEKHHKTELTKNFMKQLKTKYGSMIVEIDVVNTTINSKI